MSRMTRGNGATTNGTVAAGIVLASSRPTATRWCASAMRTQAYAAWLARHTGRDYRLPTEAEWEYAARAGSSTARYWGDDRKQACRYANVADETLRRVMNEAADPQRFFPGDDGFAFTSPVGTFLPNGFGLYDMLGNVWEWTADAWHDDFVNAPKDGSAWITTGGSSWVVRGGSWFGNPWVVRAGHRGRIGTGYRGNCSGSVWPERFDLLNLRLFTSRGVQGAKPPGGEKCSFVPVSVTIFSATPLAALPISGVSRAPLTG